eukprot:6523012-Prymnesium_polylepis.1
MSAVLHRELTPRNLVVATCQGSGRKPQALRLRGAWCCRCESVPPGRTLGSCRAAPPSFASGRCASIEVQIGVRDAQRPVRGSRAGSAAVAKRNVCCNPRVVSRGAAVGLARAS